MYIEQKKKKNLNEQTRKEKKAPTQNVMFPQKEKSRKGFCVYTIRTNKSRLKISLKSMDMILLWENVMEILSSYFSSPLNKGALVGISTLHLMSSLDSNKISQWTLMSLVISSKILWLLDYSPIWWFWWFPGLVDISFWINLFSHFMQKLKISQKTQILQFS